MPFIIAGMAYVALAGLALTPMLIGLVRGRRPSRTTLAAAIGSAVGFVFGCGAAVLTMIAGAGGQMGATLIVTSCGLAGAVLVAIVVVVTRWVRAVLNWSMAMY